MDPIVSSVPTLALSVIYCVYHGYRQALARRERTLRERVAYLLWAVAWADDEQDAA